MALIIGQILHNRYRIDAQLGQGGMGALYRAWDLHLELPVAVKENLDTSPEAQRQFSREARILARLSHSNLPRVTDHFFIEGQGQYLVMDYIEGEDLKTIVESQGALPEPQALQWIAQICDALAYLHSLPSPIIHRDIKPANIRIRADGRAMLVDFGIAKIYDPEIITTSGAQLVTPGYSPPEQYGLGPTDARSDIYSLGATIYHLLTGQKPPESVQRMAGSPTPPLRRYNPKVSPVVEEVVYKAMEVTTEKRFQNVDELRTALPKRRSDAPTRTAAPRQPLVHADSSLPKKPSAPVYPKWLPRLLWSVVFLSVGGMVVIGILWGRQIVATYFNPISTPTATPTYLSTPTASLAATTVKPGSLTPTPTSTSTASQTPKSTRRLTLTPTPSPTLVSGGNPSPPPAATVTSTRRPAPTSTPKPQPSPTKTLQPTNPPTKTLAPPNPSKTPTKTLAPP